MAGSCRHIGDIIFVDLGKLALFMAFLFTALVGYELFNFFTVDPAKAAADVFRQECARRSCKAENFGQPILRERRNMNYDYVWSSRADNEQIDILVTFFPFETIPFHTPAGWLDTDLTEGRQSP